MESLILTYFETMIMTDDDKDNRNCINIEDYNYAVALTSHIQMYKEQCTFNNPRTHSSISLSVLRSAVMLLNAACKVHANNTPCGETAITFNQCFGEFQ